MRLQLISFDLMVALPILSAAILLLFGSSYSSMSYLGGYGRSQAEALGLYYKSQLLVTLIETARPDYLQAIGMLSNASSPYQVNASLLGLGNYSSCSGLNVCRIVTVGSNAYLLVVRR